GRIIGGKEVKRHSRPYMAFLKIQTLDQFGLQTSCCGGFLIRPDAVLSAAHCCGWNMLVFLGRRVTITVILGAHNIRVREWSQQTIHVKHWVIHPNYSPDGFKNDIMLLKLKPRARINRDVQFISLPRSNERLIEGTKCAVAGWGWRSMPGHCSNVMMEVEQEVQNEEPCQHLFRNYQRQSMICVGDEYSRKAPYHGDSGGPLVCNHKAHGIVSHGLERRLFPKVFTRISYFEPWIYQQLKR
ncbi:GRAB protein, partial [Cinclus mexicanus]|nr:GRAB protein [Cinclus mexicanus]